jgi:hypothetical protein
VVVPSTDGNTGALGVADQGLQKSSEPNEVSVLVYALLAVPQTGDGSRDALQLTLTPQPVPIHVQVTEEPGEGKS